jgi:hypothetical protein
MCVIPQRPYIPLGTLLRGDASIRDLQKGVVYAQKG